MQMLTDTLVEAITRTAANTAIEKFREQQERNSPENLQYRRMRKLLGAYRDLCMIVSEEREPPTLEELEDLRFRVLSDLMQGRDRMIEKVGDHQQQQQLTLLQKGEIDRGLALYKKACQSAGPERQRRFRILWGRYIGTKARSLEELAEAEAVSPATAQRDLKQATIELAVFVRPDQL